ncbi:hypothetical protein [Thermosyntropha sp.]|uniref:hypothetical protein n=1 Tax=Thermosyntropha sp. TaxID=2740820 RepID=UPI0025F31405|nr:hypothetical protein [Thermosyntropha sp.]MBO8159168.1 hypothetical protein [Thermosyntropha sp.]
MIIIIRNWKKKAIRFLAVLVLIISFTLVVPYVAGSLQDIIPVWNSFFDEEEPSGNPMRVEKEKSSRFDQMIDSLVFDLQEFYYED